MFMMLFIQRNQPRNSESSPTDDAHGGKQDKQELEECSRPRAVGGGTGRHLPTPVCAPPNTVTDACTAALVAGQTQRVHQENTNRATSTVSLNHPQAVRLPPVVPHLPQSTLPAVAACDCLVKIRFSSCFLSICLFTRSLNCFVKAHPET